MHQFPGGTFITALAGNKFRLALNAMQSHLPGRLQVRRKGDKVLAVRGEGSIHNIHGRIGQGRYHSLRRYLVQALTDVGIPLGQEIDGAVFFRAEKFDAPVGAAGEAFELAVVSEEINLLPACFKAADHIEAFFGEEHTFNPVQPGGHFLVVDGLFAAIGRGNGKQVQGILDTGFPAYEELLAVGPPEGCAEVLILLFVKIGPDDIAS